MTRKERKKAIDALKISAPIIAVTQEEFNDYIQTLNKVMDWLEQEPCDDCISRKAVEKIINKWLSHPDYELKDSIYDMTKKIHKLPSVRPQPKIGHWINAYPDIEPNPMFMYAICSVCDFKQSVSIKLNYCPNCGAKMKEVE